jgi:hypothetical protein
VSDDKQQTITPERQAMAGQVAGVFNSIHQFLGTLKHKNEAGETLLTEQLRHAHAKVEEAGFWAVKHVLLHGTPAPAAAAPTAPAANDTPAPIGVVDPPQPLPTNDGGTPSESI